MPTMIDPLRRATQVASGEVAVRCGDVGLTYAETWDRCARLVGALRRKGMQEGDRIAVVAPDCHRYLELYMDERVLVCLVDRAKDMIVTGGENVYSTEVEEALFRHPAVHECAVFGIPDARWGEAVHAVVVLREPADPDALLSHCRTSLADYKVPKRIDLRDEPLPKSGAGKVLQRELRAPYWQGREANVAGA